MYNSTLRSYEDGLEAGDEALMGVKIGTIVPRGGGEVGEE